MNRQNLHLNFSDSELGRIEFSGHNYNTVENFSYKINILILNLFESALKEKQNDRLISTINSFCENYLFDLANYKITNKLIYQEIDQDEILSLTKLLGIISSNNDISEKVISSLNKIFALYYEHNDFIPLIYEKYIQGNKKLCSSLKSSLTAYFDSFDYLPNGFKETKILELYYRSSRQRLSGTVAGGLPKQAKAQDESFLKEEFELLYFLFKASNILEIQADLISLLEKKSKSEKHLDELLKFHFSDFILNNKLEENKLFYEEIDKIYAKNIKVEEKNFGDHLLFSTLAYLKDGNSEFGIKNFFQSIEKRISFIKNNDKELINLINNLSQSENLLDDKSHMTPITHINLDADFLPLIEQIKINFDDLLNYELKFKTNNNLILAKENIMDKFLDRKNIMTEKKAIYQEETNYYNQKLNKIIYNVNELKNLYCKKEQENSLSLKKPTKKLSEAEVSKSLEELKVFIYSRFEDMKWFLNDLSRFFRMNFNKVEDFENLKFENFEAKQNMLRNIERKIRDCSSQGPRSQHMENKSLLKFYKNLQIYIENKPITPSTDAILSEDMLNYIHNPEFILQKKIDDQSHIDSAKNYFSQYYKKISTKLPKTNLYVLENLDFLRTNLKIDLDNYLINFSSNGNFLNANDSNITYENAEALKNRIDYYEKNFNFIKQLLPKIPDYEGKPNQSGGNTESVAKQQNSNDELLKKLILFETENLSKYNNLRSSGYLSTSLITDNKPNHLIEKYLKTFTSRINKKLLLNYTSNNPRIINRIASIRSTSYPFKALNDKNLLKMLCILDRDSNKGEKNILLSLAEKLIVPKITSNKVAVFKNILNQLQSLEQAISGNNQDKSFAVHDLYSSLLKHMNINFSTHETSENLSAKEINKAQKLKEMKEMIDQNFEVFDIKHCIYMIEYGVNNNIAEGNYFYKHTHSFIK